MDLCSHEHDEVCYDGKTCPVCSLRDEKNEEIDELKAKVEQLESEVESLQEDL